MHIPLAQRLRPHSLNDIVGQQHLIGNKKPLNNIVCSGRIPNMIFYGPPGTGKTTVAKIISETSGMNLEYANGTSVSTADIKRVIDNASSITSFKGTIFYLDEIQYMNKKQQQTLLESIEKGYITLIASTTENPFFYVYNALLSRCTVFEFKPIEKKETIRAIIRAIKFLSNEMKVDIKYTDKAINYISEYCHGDIRLAINTTEICTLAFSANSKSIEINDETVLTIINKGSMCYNKTGDEHYDLLSAFQKSMRGSDANAAIYYLARLLDAGELISVCRRLLVCACEDVGLAYPGIIPIVKSCTDIAMQVGNPEARIPLADAVILVCNSPKSNSAYIAINSALNDLKFGHSEEIPRHLQNKHCDGSTETYLHQTYLYPHDYPKHWVKQQYLPNGLKNKVYYNPENNKNEQAFKIYQQGIRGALKGGLPNDKK